MVYPVTAAQAATAIKKQIEDDFESQQKRNVRQPEVCVDYLSYKFDEMDLAASWRVMTKQKKDVVDGIRLENASWRTWAKQRNNLKTISPQTLNWLKDSDVTWLYGPLHTVIRTEEDPFLKPKQATTEDTLGLMMENKPALKSALKKVTPVDLLKRSATELSLNTSANTITTDNERSTKHIKHRKISISDVNNELRAVSPAVLATHRQPRLRFNHQVEQCVALNEHDVIHEDIEEEEEDEFNTDEPLSYPSSYCSESNIISIRKIAPARLKKSQSDGDTDDVSSISSSSSTASSFNNAMTRSPMASSPAIRPQDEEEDDSELEQEYNTSTSSTAIPIPNNNHRPSSTLLQRTSSSNSITYREKSNVAEPALVTTHQTATDINRSNTSPSFFNQITQWASSYLWSNDNKN